MLDFWGVGVSTRILCQGWICFFGDFSRILPWDSSPSNITMEHGKYFFQCFCKHHLHQANLHQRKLTWMLKMDPRKRRFLLETTIFRFHVSFRGCKQDVVCLKHDVKKVTGDSPPKHEAAKQNSPMPFLKDILEIRFLSGHVTSPKTNMSP